MFSHSFIFFSSSEVALCERSPLDIIYLLGTLTSIVTTSAICSSSFTGTSKPKLGMTTLMELGSSARICLSIKLQTPGGISLS